MLKLFFFLMLSPAAPSWAVVPYSVQDVAVEENFAYVNAQLKALASSPGLYQLGDSVLYVRNIAKTQSYFLDVDAAGALTVNSTTTVVATPWVLVTDRRGTKTCRVSVAADGALQVDVLPFVLAGTPTTICTANGRVYALDVLNGNVVTLTYLGVFTL